jgi:WD40 repeat protein
MRIRSIRRRAVWLGLITSLILTLAEPRAASAQVAPAGFFTDPILVLRVGGHQAPVRSIVFTPGGTQLLTGGMDKIINVWNLDVDRSGPVRSIRPPQWRGPRGQINAMALSPRDDGGNQRLLAVAGFGVLSNAGEILLFRYPGPNPQGTVDVEAQFTATGPTGPGHRNPVTSLAFTPDGNFLVSASLDKTIRIWEIATKRQVAVMEEATRAVNSLAITANGRSLIAGGEDGILRLYDISDRSRPSLTGSRPPAKANLHPDFNVITTLAVSPDGSTVVVGTYGGWLVRYNLADLGGAQFLSNVQAGPILALAISPDSTRFASSSARAVGPTELPGTSSVVELRSLPLGQVLERLPEEADIVQALAFSPDGRRLVYSGGNAQAISIKELAPGSPPIPDEIKGSGTNIWDVGFRTDSRAIRFARTRAAVAGQAVDYEYFDLRDRAFFNPGPNEPPYRHAVASEASWTIRPSASYQFEFRNALNQGWDRPLETNLEGRWWAYTVIPPGPGHLQPVAAVAVNSGQIILWNLATGVKTRIFNGHQTRVVALASSPDGRWLVTGSSDQTVRLWSLTDCDKRPPLGASFVRRANGTWIVTEVTPGGFAEGIGLQKNHVVERFAEGVNFVDPSAYLPKLDSSVPGESYTFEARMNGDPNQPLLQALTTKRDSPALSLFPGVDRRWVLWTPRGFYDSSADGDRKFLGWLTNRGTVAQLLASTYDSIDKFEARFRQPKARQPNVIDRLLDTANPIQAEAVALAAPANPAQPPPPDPVTSRLAALDIGPVTPAPPDRPIVAASPTLPLKYRVLAQAGAAGVSRLWVEVNGRIVANLIAKNAPPVREAQGQSEIPIGTDRAVRVSLVAIDERGVRRDQPLDVTNQAPLPLTPRKSRLEIVAIGAEEFADRRFPRIPYAEEDARDLARFLGEKLVDPATGTKFPATQVQARTFLGGKLARANLSEAFDTLTRPGNGEPLGPGDVVVVVVESHYLDFHSKRLLATTEHDLGQPDPPSFSATDLADRLGELTKAGCRAILLLDAVHELKTPAWDLEIQEWVRQLQGQTRAIAFIAADHGPSSPNGDGHRVFAQGVLDVLKAKSAGRLRKPGGTMSLFDFQRTVTDSVLQQTGRKQHAQCYLPDTISFQVPFLDPSPR